MSSADPQNEGSDDAHKSEASSDASMSTDVLVELAQHVYEMLLSDRPQPDEASEEEEGSELGDSPLLALPPEIIRKIVGFVAASEREGIAEGTFRAQHGYRGSFYDGSMTTTCALALTGRALSAPAIDELWLKIEFPTFDLKRILRVMADDDDGEDVERPPPAALADSRGLGRTRCLHIVGYGWQKQHSSKASALEDATMLGLRHILERATALRCISLDLHNEGIALTTIATLHSMQLRLKELSISFANASARLDNRRGAWDTFWRDDFRPFLAQQKPTLERLSLTLREWDRKPVEGVFDLAQILAGMSDLKHLDFTPLTLNSWSLPVKQPMPPLRSLILRQSRFDWVAQHLLPAVANTLEELYLHYDPPGSSFLKPDDPSYSDATNYHFLSKEKTVFFKPLEKLRRLSISIAADKDGPRELLHLLFSFVFCSSITQLWICVRVHAHSQGLSTLISDYFYDNICVTLEDRDTYTGLRELLFAVDGEFNVEMGKTDGRPAWPGYSWTFRMRHAPSLRHRGLTLKIRGMAEDFDVPPDEVDDPEADEPDHWSDGQFCLTSDGHYLAGGPTAGRKRRRVDESDDEDDGDNLSDTGSEASSARLRLYEEEEDGVVDSDEVMGLVTDQYEHSKTLSDTPASKRFKQTASVAYYVTVVELGKVNEQEMEGM